jgi:hypothetical protein
MYRFDIHMLHTNHDLCVDELETGFLLHVGAVWGTLFYFLGETPFVHTIANCHMVKRLGL